MTQILELEKYAAKARPPYLGASGNNSVEISKNQNTNLNIPVTITEPGLYAIDFRYANGEGPISTSNKCAIRTLKKENNFMGTVVLPQRGLNEWTDWGFSNPVQVRLAPGTHHLSLTYEPVNENMNGEVNRALLDYIRIRKIAE